MSIQNLIQEFKAVVFEKVELEFRGMYEVKAQPFLAYRHSISILKIVFTNEQSVLGIKLSRLTP